MNNPILISQKSVNIKSNKELLWEYIANPKKWKLCDINVKDASIDGELQVGVTGEIIQTEGPKVKFKVTKLDPYKSINFSSKLITADMNFDHLIEEVGTDEYKVTYTITSHGFGSPLFSRLFRPMFTKSLESIMRNMKIIAEVN